MTTTLGQKYFRAGIARGTETASPVDRTGGMFGAGLISGVSVITRGEALGHDLWIDADFLTDITGAINQSENGVKARFTHPGMCSDGMANKLGKINNARTVGDQVYADLHFQDAAHKTPEGDLADYVMGLAEETPEDFGLSIVFEWDEDEMNRFVDENTVTTQGRDIFTSPDEDNQNNYTHARLSRLRTADVVDEPAANPLGLFSVDKTPALAESAISYVLGLSEAKPDAIGGIDPDRMASFFAGYLERHHLEVKAKEMPEDNKADSVDLNAIQNDVRAQMKAEGERFSAAFGADGSTWFFEGITFEAAQERHIEKLEKQILKQESELSELKQRLESLDTGEPEPAEVDGQEKPQKKTFASRIRINGAAAPVSAN